MRYIIEYIKSLFCKHKFKYEESWYISKGWAGEVIKKGYKVSATCKKCGYHKSYWKF